MCIGRRFAENELHILVAKVTTTTKKQEFRDDSSFMQIEKGDERMKKNRQSQMLILNFVFFSFYSSSESIKSNIATANLRTK